MLKIFSVYDSKAEAYGSPAFITTRASAIRSFGASATDPNTDFGRFPADYTLFELGEFDPGPGIFKIHEIKVNLGSALEHANAISGENS